MARNAPLTVTLSAREVVAFGEGFRRSGEELHDAGVALDWIADLRPRGEPVVLRAVARGGSRAERSSVEGDWLCEPDGSPPRRLPRPDWRFSAESEAWSRQRELIDAWEGCAFASWMLRGCGDAGVDARLITLAACDCARLSLASLPQGEVRPGLAIEAARAWAEGQASRYEVRGAGFAAAAAAGELDSEAAIHAAEAAYATAAVAYAADAAHSAALSVGPGATADSMADVVRSRVTTLAVLRAAARRGPKRGAARATGAGAGRAHPRRQRA